MTPRLTALSHIAEDSGMRLRFYGQNGEDAILWRFFNRSDGFYVDVGAFDGLYLSNTKVFEDAGWQGLLVEALPEYAEIARANRSARVVNAAVGSDNGTVMLQADTTGLFSSTKDPKIGEIDQHFKASGLDPPTWTNVQVPAVTLQELLDECPPVDLLALDIEGAEIDALKGLGDHRPRVLLVEAGEEERKANDAFLETIGYERARSLLWNHFYCHARPDVERLRSVTAVAWLQRPPHPTRPELSRIGYPGKRLRIIR
jgi:FkbM family methyltransferase